METEFRMEQQHDKRPHTRLDDALEIACYVFMIAVLVAFFIVLCS